LRHRRDLADMENGCGRSHSRGDRLSAAAAVLSASRAPSSRTTELYERYSRQILAFCRHRLGNREEAEDATQTTFLNAFRGLERGVVPQLEQAWLFTIAERVCQTRRRSSTRRSRVECPSDLDALQDVLPSPPRVTDELIPLPEALAGMPPQQRRALLLREWRGLTYREIAAELDLSQAAVETLLFRARRALARNLDEAGVMRPAAPRRIRA
jgi:RNA polymerase sigma factor (sigma-70 family)